MGARVAAIFPIVLKEIDAWFAEATLASRHSKVSSYVDKISPALMTFVEYDEQWRQQALPTSRSYAMVHGKGTAVVVFDADVYERVTELDGVAISSSVPAITSELVVHGDGKEYQIAPKSSCVVGLRRRADSSLFLVTAVHLESAPPSESLKVNVRALQLRALQTYLSNISKQLAAKGHSCVFVLGGDFNALPEEFLHGNGAEFWEDARVLAVQPPLRRPSAGKPTIGPPVPPLVRAGDNGRWHLLCEGMDGGELHESSRVSDVTCSRAGYSMVIDFIFVGTVGHSSIAAEPVVTSTPEQSARAADKDYGVFNAVMNWGSDHLPVGAEISIKS